MDVTLSIRPGDDGTVVAVSGEVDVCTEAPLQQALLQIMREHVRAGYSARRVRFSLTVALRRGDLAAAAEYRAAAVRLSAAYSRLPVSG